MKSINYNCKGNEAQWDEVKPCSVGVAITWLAKFHPDVVKARDSEIKYCWHDITLFRNQNNRGHTRKEIRHFLLNSVVADHKSRLIHTITRKRNAHMTTFSCMAFRNECGRVYALKKLPQKKSTSKDKSAPIYIKERVPLWDFFEGMESELVVDQTEFRPTLTPEPLHIQQEKNCFNKFAKFNHKYNPNLKIDESQFDLILQHICEVWCDDQQDLFDYVTKWMAHLVQQPYKTGVALIIYLHEHGTGKTLFAEWIANHIIGAKDCLISKNMGDVLSPKVG